MIPIETQIFQLIFPPAGSVPLDKIETVPLIRQHIDSIITLASEGRASNREESANLTARVVELRDHPGPDGKTRSWLTIAKICGTTKDAVRRRYYNHTTKKAAAEVETPIDIAIEEVPTIRESRIVDGATICEPVQKSHPAIAEDSQLYTAGPSPGYEAIPISKINQLEQPEYIQTEPLQEAEPAQIETHAELEQKTEEPPTIRESRNVPLDPKTLAEVDRMLGEGIGVLDITAELEKKGKLVPWTKIRARAAYLAKMRRKEVAPEPEKADDPEPVAQPGEEPQEVEATEDRLEPVAISRKELDLRIWDMWRAGKTLDEISDILYSEGLYYGPKSVRVRLLSQGAKL